ncbi:hypothetical protein VNO78_31316 [Psophocarpus tetragonolobus]|uniref:Uncharacterized protein n=1 Tax=Psophocarpus tetragonolobus TaxID=3891 RepID=A0AAN9X7E5_PSOTE
MEGCGISFKCDWTNLLRVQFFFQPSIWGVDLLKDHPLQCGKFLYLQNHVIFQEMETFQEFLAESSNGCSSFVAQFVSEKLTLGLKLSSSISSLDIATPRVEDHLSIEIDAADGGERVDAHTSKFPSNRSNSGDQQIPLLRMVGDGYNWKNIKIK